MLPEEREYGVFLGREIDLDIISHHSLSIEIHTDISDLIGLPSHEYLISSTTPEDILDTQTELFEVERLDQIVIRPECESLDTIDLLAECREKKKRNHESSRLHHANE